jgi:hypothetical protein
MRPDEPLTRRVLAIGSKGSGYPYRAGRVFPADFRLFRDNSVAREWREWTRIKILQEETESAEAGAESMQPEIKVRGSLVFEPLSYLRCLL